MARKKNFSSSASFKKNEISSNKKQIAIQSNDKKVKTISQKITKINKNFENLILECQTALSHLNESKEIRKFK